MPGWSSLCEVAVTNTAHSTTHTVLFDIHQINHIIRTREELQKCYDGGARRAVAMRDRLIKHGRGRFADFIQVFLRFSDLPSRGIIQAIFVKSYDRVQLREIRYFVLCLVLRLGMENFF